jgi:DNA-3-methyladenine glycosylase II
VTKSTTNAKPSGRPLPRRQLWPSDAENKLSALDPKLGRLIDAVIAAAGRQTAPPSKASPFEALVRAVVYQSIAAKAAEAIYHRLKDKVGGKLTPANLGALTSRQIASVGLSGSKARTIRDLATWFATHPKSARALPTMSDEEVVTTLTSIAGIGAWTANVFLIFNLHRPDVMPAVDLGLRRGVQLIYGLPAVATAKEVQAAADHWRPYRSIACIYLWQAIKRKVAV